MNVRVGVEGDLEWILRVAQEVREAPQWSVEDYRRVLGEQGGPVVRRVFAREAVGFAVGMVIRMGSICEGEIENVAVVPEARRSGVGRALCAAVVGWCRELGAQVVRLEVRESNAGAIALYGQLGFERTGMRKGYYRGPDEDAVVMERRWREG